MTGPLRLGARSLFEELRVGRGPGALLARGSGSAFAIRAGGLAIVLGNQILLARVLGTSSYGDYVYVVTWLTVLVLLATGGPSGAAVRFVSQYVGQADWAGLWGFIRRAYQWGVGAALVFAGGVALTTWQLTDRIGDSLASTFWVGALLLPVWASMELTSASLRGFKRIVAAQLPPEVARPGLFAVTIGVLWVSGRRPVEAPVALAANFAVTGVCLVVMTRLLRGSLSALPKARPHNRPAEWRGVAFPLLLMGAFGMVLSSTDTIMLGAMRSTTEAGIYSVATRGAGLVAFMLAAANLIAAPLISEYHATGQERRLRRLLGLTAWLASGFAVPVAGVLWVAGPSLLGLFGVDFVAGYKPMMILMAAQLANVACGSVVYLLAMSGNQTRATIVVGAAACINVLLNAALIPRFGSLGAAASSASSMLLWNVVLAAYAVRGMHLNPTVFQRWWR